MRVLITRPADDAAPLAAALAGHGIDTVVVPLLEIACRTGPTLDLSGVQALMATSANGVRALARRTPRRDVPVYAVGDATARAAAAAGFTTVDSAAGDVGALADLVGRRADPAHGALVHAAGTAVAGDLGGRLAALGFDVRREVLYEARTAERLPEAMGAALLGQSLDGAAFYSPRTATTFVRLVGDAGLPARCRALTAYCLSEAVAEAVGKLPWRHVSVARKPDQEGMIALIREGTAAVRG